MSASEKTPSGVRAARLSLPQMRDIYEREASRDFPADELKPFSVIQRQFERGRYTGYGFYPEECDATGGEEASEKEKNGLLAYVFFMSLPDVKNVLIDYLAVLPEHRSGGYGSAILSLMRAELSWACGIIIEVENPHGCSPSQREERLRRVAFYERNGARLTDVGLRVYTAHYRLMYLPLQGDADDAAIRGDLSRIYRSFFSKERYEKSVEFTSLHTL